MEKRRKQQLPAIAVLMFPGVGFYIHDEGYWRATTGTERGQYLHRMIAEKILRRKLTRVEIVHHENRRRRDNDPGNLTVMHKKEHDGIVERCPYRGIFLSPRQVKKQAELERGLNLAEVA